MYTEHVFLTPFSGSGHPELPARSCLDSHNEPNSERRDEVHMLGQ